MAFLYSIFDNPFARKALEQVVVPNYISDNLKYDIRPYQEESFLNYNVDIKKQDEHIEEFQQLELKQQKEHLVELLDKNQLYVNLSSINDKDFKVTEAEKKATKDFYQIKG